MNTLLVNGCPVALGRGWVPVTMGDLSDRFAREIRAQDGTPHAMNEHSESVVFTVDRADGATDIYALYAHAMTYVWTITATGHKEYR